MNRNDNKTAMRILLPAALLLLAVPAMANSTESAAKDYESLMKWEFSTSAIALPENGIRFQRDGAEWILGGGTVRPMRPTSDGSVTGLVFEGSGRFRMEIPDKVEVNQLKRFGVRRHDSAEREDRPECTFGRMILRTTDDGLIDLFPGVTDGTYAEHPLSQRRHLWWLEHARFDVDARVVAGLLNQDNEYLAIDMETDEHGWLFYEFDEWRMEEIRLSKMRSTFDFVEVWVSLDRAEHRRPDGRPGDTRTPLIDLLHADLEVDLWNHRGRRGLEISRKRWDMEYPLTRFRAQMEFESEVDGLQALPLRLNPWAGAVTVTDAAGKTLTVLRAPLGKRFPLIMPHEEDTSLVVLLAEPLARGERAVLDFTWERQTGNAPGRHDPHPVYTRPSIPYLAGGGQDWYPPFTHQSGRYWYPEPLEGRDDRHTARMTIVHPRRLKVRATGTPTGGRREGRRRYSSWESKTPIKAAAFSYGHGYKERRILKDGLPEVISFGANRWQQVGDTVEAVAAHIADSIQFYQLAFEYELPLETVTGTRADSASQSFSGFITYDSTTFNLIRSWNSERELARMTADLFWGELLDWESYRDQWLADSLANYSAMMYLEAVTESWDPRQKGVIGTYDEYLRLKQRRLAYATSHRNQRLGPLDLGFRDIVPELISGPPSSNSMSISNRGSSPPPPPPQRRNLLTNSSKGPAVLHMLRGILMGRSEDGARQFNAILGDFIETHAGGTATTRDFIAAVEQRTGEDWGWFFDQWVFGTDVPSYEWAHTVSPEPDADGQYVLEIRMEQRGVSPDFRMPVTFGLEYGDAEAELLHFEMERPSKTFTVRLPKRPVKVTFDPNHDLLYVKE